MVEDFLFVAFPYAAVAIGVLVGLYRYFTDRFTFSSFSSQFLENRALFWGSVPWHYGILLLLGAHLIAAVYPSGWGDLIADPRRLYTLEGIGLALAVMTMAGLVLLILRRMMNPRIFSVTSAMDWALFLVLIGQVALGFWVALVYRWGSDWFLHTAQPWLLSLVKFQPETAMITNLPWVVKLHMLGGFLIVGMYPFTRLVHVTTFPLTYLWRPYQVVIWNRRIRAAKEKAAETVR